MDSDTEDKPLIVTNVGSDFRLEFHGPIQADVTWLETDLDNVVKSKPKVVAIDLADAEYISSVGLGILVRFSQHIVKGGGRVHIVKIRKLTLAALRATKLDRTLNVGSSTEVVGA